MRCSRVQYLYEEYVVGTLEPETMTRIDTHIATCAVCRDFYESNDDLAQILSDGNEVNHPGEIYVNGLTSKVLAAISVPGAKLAADPEPVRRACVFQEFKPWRRPLWWAGAAAAASLLMVGVSVEEQAHGPAPDVAAVSEFEPQLDNRDVTWANFQTRMIPSGLAPTEVSMRGQTLARNRQPASMTDPNIEKSARDARDHARGVDHSSSGTADSALDVDVRTIVFSFMTPARDSEPPVRVPPRRAPAQGINLNLNLPSDIVEELLVLDCMGTDESRAKFSRLVSEIRSDASWADTSQPARAAQNPALVEQWKLYREAVSHLQNNGVDAARSGLERALTINGDSRLASRSRFQLAELHFDRRGDFERAREYYRRCADQDASEALTPDEKRRVELRLQALDRYAVKQWKPLALLHGIRTESWDKVVGLIRESTAAPEAQAILPVASRHVLDRLGAGDVPSAKARLTLIEALRAGGESLNHVPATKAWVSLATAETLLIAGGDAAEAARAYQVVTQLDPTSPAATVARDRLERISQVSRRRSR